MSTGSTKSLLEVRVRSVTFEAEDILRFELVDTAGGSLPAFEAGAHIDVHVDSGFVRQYSLCGDPSDTSSYHIAVLNEPAGRGGSRALHERVRPGDVLSISEPRNFFRLSSSARQHLLLAGGIGVTPMMAMVEELEARDAKWQMHYCTRSAEKTAFRDRLAPLVASGKVTVHHDGGDPANGLDIASLLAQANPDVHVYYCGPAGFMTAVADSAAHWPASSVHCEYFTAPEETNQAPSPNTSFEVEISSTGDVIQVPAEKSIVAVLRENGHYVDTSCEDGYCGTCLTPYVDGEPEHRDSVLDDEDRRRYVLICCARSKTPRLVLDM